MKTQNQRGLWLVVIPALCLGVTFVGLAVASNVTVPHAFTPGTPADADEVNANFNALADAVNDNDARVAALENAQPPRPLAAVHVFWGAIAQALTIIKSRNALEDGEPITVTRTSVGVYVCDFGSTPVAHSALGQGYLAVTKGGIDGPGLATAQWDNAGAAATVIVNIYDETGMPEDSSFYLMVH